MAVTTALANLARPSALAIDRVRRRGELPVVLCIDVEPDGRSLDLANPGGWDGFVELMRTLPAVRERLSEASGAPVAFSWFLRMDPQIERVYGSTAWVVDQWGSEIEALAEQGDQFGLHTHDWRWSEEVDNWVAINGEPEWEAEVVEMAVAAFHTSLGRPVAGHRGGMHMTTPAMLEALARSGVKADLTPEPGLAPQGGWPGEHFRGKSPDWRLAGSTPYRISAESFPAPDPGSKAEPLLMPLFSAPTRRGGRTPLTLWSEPGAFAGRLGLEMLRATPPVAVFPIRSNVVLQKRWTKVEANLEHVARHRGVRFVNVGAGAAPFLAD